MSQEIHVKIFEGNDSYKLLDSGNKCRLEEVGRIRVARSEPRAWWGCGLGEEEWKKAVAYFNPSTTLGAGEWKFKKKIPKELDIEISGMKAKVKFAGTSKHIGIFPEQAEQWQWIESKLQTKKSNIESLNVLNLFGYTGMATLAAAKAGAKVTHVDGSRLSIAWAKENQKLNGLGDAPIRWILDDAKSFLKREVKRGVKYDAIIMDPPTFGRGVKGEVWKIERDLTETLELCRELLSDNPLFILINMYATELSPISLGNILQDFTKGLGGQIEIGELTIKHSSSDRLLPTSIFTRWFMV